MTAIDPIPNALANLVENAAAPGQSDRVETVNADFESWAFPADDAGLIIAFTALEHVSSGRILRLTRAVPCRNHPWRRQRDWDRRGP